MSDPRSRRPGPPGSRSWTTAQDLERKSSAVTLSDMEVFIFPELMYSLVLANIMSPRIWKWRDDPWFDGAEQDDALPAHHPAQAVHHGPLRLQPRPRHLGPHHQADRDRPVQGLRRAPKLWRSPTPCSATRATSTTSTSTSARTSASTSTRATSSPTGRPRPSRPWTPSATSPTTPPAPASASRWPPSTQRPCSSWAGAADATSS